MCLFMFWYYYASIILWCPGLDHTINNKFTIKCKHMTLSSVCSIIHLFFYYFQTKLLLCIHIVNSRKYWYFTWFYRMNCSLSYYSLLVFSAGQWLCIHSYVPRANFLTTLRSHLDVTCSSYFWHSLFYVDVNYSYIYI